MTSFMIGEHVGRKLHTDWQDPRCSFCRIVADELPSTRVYENDKVIAILDILPLRTGHTLVIPKIHCSRVSELPSDVAAAMGEAVTKVARALTEAMDKTALNIVCNQEYAQAVPHVHYHIIPAPTFGSSSSINIPHTTKSKEPTTTRELHQREYEARDELDEEEGHALALKVRAKL